MRFRVPARGGDAAVLGSAGVVLNKRANAKNQIKNANVFTFGNDIMNTIERIVYPIPSDIEDALDGLTKTIIVSRSDIDLYLYLRDQRTTILRRRWAMGAHSLTYCRVMEELKIRGGRRSAWDRRGAAVHAWYKRRLERKTLSILRMLETNPLVKHSTAQT